MNRLPHTPLRLELLHWREELTPRGDGRRVGRIVAAMVAAAVCALTFVATASAHALLVRSVPEANATLARAPAQVEIYFSESLEASFSSIAVLDSTGAAVDNGDVKLDPADPTHLSVSLRSLADGVYTVSWRALSASDGHLTTGSFPFAVGSVAAGDLAAAQSTARVRLSLGEAFTRWLLYLAAAAVIGGLFFRIAVWEPAWYGAAPPDQDVIEPGELLFPSGLTLLLVATVLGLIVQAGQVSGAEVALPWSNSFNTLLFTTRSGAVWNARLAASILMVALIVRIDRPAFRWPALGISILMLLTISLGSHAAAEPVPALPVAADWLHLVGACVWVGGLMHFVAGMWRVRASDSSFRARLTALLIPRFSALALTSVGVLTLSGLYSAILRVGTPDALVQTLYGRILIIKGVIIVPMIVLGAVNLLVITPRMRDAATISEGDVSLVQRFRRIIASEITLGIALLLSVGILTSAPPARVTATTAGIRASADADDLHLQLEIAPGKVGVNTFSLSATANGRPLNDAKEVSLQFTPSLANIPPSKISLSGQGDGRYAVKGAFLSLPGDWQVQVVVRRADHFDAFTNFEFSVRTAAGSASFPWNRVAGPLLVIAGVASYFALRKLTPGIHLYRIVPGSAAVSLIVVGVAVFLRPLPAGRAGLVNPIPPNPPSIAAGRESYMTSCVPCHGMTGKGDGPVGVTLNRRPADLTLHAVPGVHTDGQLYEWITNGFPGSVMPVFRTVLSDDDRWNLVNFIRTLAPR